MRKILKETEVPGLANIKVLGPGKAPGLRVVIALQEGVEEAELPLEALQEAITVAKKPNAAMERANRYHSYLKGWADGVARRDRDSRAYCHPVYGPAYNDGYQDGGDAYSKAASWGTAKYKHKPSILRTPPEDLG